MRTAYHALQGPTQSGSFLTSFYTFEPHGAFLLLWKHTNSLQVTLLLQKFQNDLFPLPRPLLCLPSLRMGSKVPSSWMSSSATLAPTLNHLLSHHPAFSPLVLSQCWLLFLFAYCLLSPQKCYFHEGRGLASLIYNELPEPGSVPGSCW